MRPILFATTLVLAACTTQPGTGASRATTGTTIAGTEDSDDQVCGEETPLGSNIPRMVCRSRLQSQLDRDGAQSWQARDRARPCKTPAQCASGALDDFTGKR